MGYARLRGGVREAVRAVRRGVVMNGMLKVRRWHEVGRFVGGHKVR